MNRWLIALALCALTVAQEQDATIRLAVDEVRLDLVVRDRRGKPVRDLKPEEIEILDEGTARPIRGFRLIAGTSATTHRDPEETRTIEARPLDAERQLRLVSFVFDSLDNDSRRLARLAALDFLKEPLEANVYVAVFTVDHRLRIVQPFSNDRAVLRTAVERATSGMADTQLVAAAERVRADLQKAQDAAEAQAAQPAATGGRGGPPSGMNQQGDAMLAQMMLNMLQTEDRLIRTQLSFTTLAALSAIVTEQAKLPGRKTVIYMSMGMRIPSDRDQALRTLISRANRANVTFYTVDARGLSSEAMNASATAMLKASAAAAATAANVNNAVTPQQVRAFDTAMESINSNPQQALHTLASDTGGFLIANTNDFRDPFRRVQEDIHTYYELTYGPEIKDYDGSFRRIAVKVNRPGVKVQARSGYFAFPPGHEDVQPFEAPLLRLLSEKSAVHDVPFTAAAVRAFSDGGRQQYSVVVEVPFGALTFVDDPERKQKRARVPMLAMIKDESGKVVERFSRDPGFFATSEQLETMQERNFVQWYPTQLPPGRYTLETAVMDAEGNKAGSRRVAVVAPAAGPGAAISDLVLIARLHEDKDADGVFVYDGKTVVPTLDDTVEATANGVSVFLIVHPAAGSSEKLRFGVELSRDGKVVASAAPALPKPDARGLIPYVVSFPMKQLEPGQYEIRAAVQQGGPARQSRLSFRIVEKR